MKIHNIVPFVSLIWLFLLMACGSANQTTNAPSENGAAETTSIDGYPAPQGILESIQSSDSYPPPATVLPEIGYPVEEPVNPNAILMAIDRPVDVNDTTITGVGPAGLTIFILDITLMGNELGRTVIAEDGTFSVEVSGLQSGTRIGLSADITTIGLTENDVIAGAGEISTPRVGYFYDSVVLGP